MNPRLALYELAGRYRLDATATSALLADAGLRSEPPSLARRFRPAVLVLAAALGGLGVILWLAANWDTLGRGGRFALLQGTVAVMCAGAAWRPALRASLGLAALLSIGGLFAYFGQTYQTGADPWQLFALWALLALPLAFAARSDVVWAPWALVAMTAVSLWTHAHTGHRWRVESQDLGVYAAAWIASGALVAALGPAATRWTGAGPWALRTAATLAVIGITLAALGALFHRSVAAHYPLALVLFAAAAVLLSRRRGFEIFALSAVALALNVLVVAGLARLLFDRGGGDPIGRFLFIGLVAAGLLALSVTVITRLARLHAPEALR
jgi:uncharacterized membrane protein